MSAAMARQAHMTTPQDSTPAERRATALSVQQHFRALLEILDAQDGDEPELVPARANAEKGLQLITRLLDSMGGDASH